jgi:hypothetical protein
MKIIINLILLVACTISATAQTFTETIKKEMAFEKAGVENTVLVSNINGDVHVTGYAGNKVLIEVTKKIWAKTVRGW